MVYSGYKLSNEEPINWSNLEHAARRSSEILTRLAADKALLTELTMQAKESSDLFSLCESHELDDKIVIYDVLEEKNFRIRWRLANTNQHERIHCHRFSFTTKILYGYHMETLYGTSQKTLDNMTLEDFKPIMCRRLVPQQSFTIYHETFHSSVTSADAIALLLRGPAEKLKAPIIRKDTAEKWFRLGAESETTERRNQVAMDEATYLKWIKFLKLTNLIF
jgi:hypothetical protein